MEFNDLEEFPSLYQVKKIVQEMSGIEAVVHDMCVNSCVGFTGPFSDLDQ